MVLSGFLGSIKKSQTGHFGCIFLVFLHVHESLVFSAFGDVPAATKNVGFEKKSCFYVFRPLIEVKSHSRTLHKCRIASRVILGKIKIFEILTREGYLLSHVEIQNKGGYLLSKIWYTGIYIYT